MICPACPTGAAPIAVEEHLDPIGQKKYRILRCADCGVVFSEPRVAVGPDWYEKAAPIRARETPAPPERDWRYRQFLMKVAPGKILDVGCGGGGFLLLAKRRGFDCWGFDYEKRMIEVARARGINNVESAEFGAFCRAHKDDEFDAITLFDVLEHTPEPGQMLTQLKRLLRVGGHIAITLPNALRPTPWGREEHDYPPHHFTRWTPMAMRAFLERNGFRVTIQKVSPLGLYYLADHFFFYRLMPGALALARRALFGKKSSPGKTISDLYAAEPEKKTAGGLKSRLADKLVRQRLVNLFKALTRPICWPVAAAVSLSWRLRRRDCGDCLFTLARLENKG